MIRKILVYENALADKHPALERALLLARDSNVKLKVVDVAVGPSDVLRELHRPLHSLVEHERNDRLNAICEPLREQNIDFTTELISGRPFVEIVREVVHEGFHLVIKTAAGAQPTEVLGMMGPVDMRLVRNCPCPVWLETASRVVRCQRVLVAVDPQAEHEELNQVLVEMGVSLTKTNGGQLHVVAAWKVPDEDFLATKMKPEAMKRYVDDVRLLAEQSLDALLVGAGKPALQSNCHLHKGDPARTILDRVESIQPDVVVVGTVCDTSVHGLLIGNTCDTMLRQINCSVLAVKPDSLFRA